MPKFDYLVLKPKPFDFGDGVERIMEIGSRIPGHIAETWGNEGRAVDHLTNQGVLAPVPVDEAANKGWDADFDAPDVLTVEDAPIEVAAAPVKPAFPRHIVAGKFELSDGTKVQGKTAALAAQAKLDEAVDA